MPKVWQAARPYLILAVLGSGLIGPLLGPEMPCTDDGQLYYYQVAVLRYGIEQGLLISRWLPDAALGYGIPLFNYREVPPRYLPLLLHLMGFGLPRALNLVSALMILLCGWGTYRLARDLFESERAGLGAGLVAMTAPYLLITVYRRGALPELVALALIPWVVWAMQRSLRSGQAMALAATLWAGLILSHNISALLLAPVLGSYALALAWLIRRIEPGESRTSLATRLRPIAAYLGGLVLAAFYWIPALLERNLVQIGAATATRNNNYVFNFATLAEVLAPPAAYNPAWLNPSMVFPLGLPGLGLALIGLVGGWLRYEGRSQRRPGIRMHLIGFALVGALYVMMALPVTRPIWDVVPLLAYVQFPWRLIGRAALPLAVLAGVGLEVVGGEIERLSGRASLSALWAGGMAALLIGVGLPAAYPVQWCPTPPAPTIQDVNRFEREVLPGLDNEGSYFPLGVTPPHDTPLLADYATGRTPDRFDRGVLPVNAHVTVRYRPLGADIFVETPQRFRARYLSYAFPGWQVRIDGQQAAIMTETGSGLITFDVPPGSHRIAIRFGMTPLRAWATSASLIGLGSLVWSTWRGKSTSRHEAQPSPMGGQMWLALAVVGAALGVARLAWPADLPAPWRMARPPTPEHRLAVIFEGQVALLGYTTDPDIWPADTELRVDTIWQRVADMDRNVQVALVVVDAEGYIWSEKEGARPRDYEQPPLATFLWPRESFMVDSQMIRLLPGTPPGDYTLAVTLFQSETGIPLVAPGPLEGVISRVPLGPIRVAWPHHPWEVADLPIQHRLGIQLGDLILLGYNLDRDEVTPGETVLVTLFWGSRRGLGEMPNAALLFDGRVLSVGETKSLSPLPEGERWRQQIFLRVPAGAEAGRHDIRLQVGKEAPIILADITVGEVSRRFDPPTVEIPLEAVFGEAARLVGLSIESGDEQLALSLVWRGEADMPVSYTVFVHALDGAGNLLAQDDAIPAGGARPTTGWLPGEYVLDTHSLPITAEQVAALRIGLYDPISGMRLRLADGSDALNVALP